MLIFFYYYFEIGKYLLLNFIKKRKHIKVDKLNLIVIFLRLTRAAVHIFQLMTFGYYTVTLLT